MKFNLCDTQLQTRKVKGNKYTELHATNLQVMPGGALLRLFGGQEQGSVSSGSSNSCLFNPFTPRVSSGDIRVVLTFDSVDEIL